MPRITDLVPDRGTYMPGETVSVTATLDGADASHRLRFRLTRLASPVAETEVVLDPDQNAATYELDPPPERAGYGLTADLLDVNGRVQSSFHTAFDVLPSWTHWPRYGFLTDFTPDRSPDRAIEELVRHHVNGIQFYDWMYRHDQPVPPVEGTFTDPLGRSLSTETIRELIAQARAHGMASMAYLAVYAGSPEFASAHRAWRMYDVDGQPEMFEGDFLALMDPSPGSPWTEHLLARCGEALEFGFDGIHMDQYGEPREGFDNTGAPIDLPNSFRAFVEELQHHHPQAPRAFNAVKNWPIDELAAAPVDFVYTELWPDTPTYQDLVDAVVLDSRLSGGKPVVVALYLDAGWAENVLVADALIIAAGGSRIEIGEEGRLLTDPYFPKHQPLGGLGERLRRYADFRVEYGELLEGTPLAEPSSTGPDGTWVFERTTDASRTVHIVNMSGLEDQRWDVAHGRPHRIPPSTLRLSTEDRPNRVWAVEPERATATDLPWSLEGGELTVDLPVIDHWLMVVVEDGGPERTP